MKTLLTLPTLIAVLVTGFTTSSLAVDRPRQKLHFLVDGRTTRAAVFEAIGSPSGIYERGRIQTYRLSGNERDGFSIQGHSSAMLTEAHLSWATTSHSLVLVFDPDGTLRRHSLIKVN